VRARRLTVALALLGACSPESPSTRPLAGGDVASTDAPRAADATPAAAETATAAQDVAQLAADASLPLRLLVFTRTEGWRHDSIAEGVKAVQQLAAPRGWLVDHTEDPAQFTAANLAQYRAVIWLNTTGDVLDSPQEQAFESYMLGGGGYVGVHAACDTEYDWPFYGGLVAAYFSSHPPGVHQAKLVIEDKNHPATAGLPDPWLHSDEWYNFTSNPRPDVTVLMALDESSYSGGAMGDHPIAWHHAVGQGRALYTGLGHTAAAFQEPAMLDHLAGAIAWAAGL
jgi:type 1 glutamine amidotransferase